MLSLIRAAALGEVRVQPHVLPFAEQLLDLHGDGDGMNTVVGREPEIHVVDPSPERAGVVALHRVRRHRDDRDVPRPGIALQLPRQRETVHAGELDVHQDQTRPECLQQQ